ncbi:hypothetical protein, partial [Qipengyuania sp.]|uniref:hypothetical protein n=1 Tax=Qipengyuania sp. TaxID=2004515 RepID=UPI0035132447
KDDQGREGHRKKGADPGNSEIGLEPHAPLDSEKVLNKYSIAGRVLARRHQVCIALRRVLRLTAPT